MNQWTADFVNDPRDDYNLVIEILCDDEEVAVIKQVKGELEMKWYPSSDELTIPVNWLHGLLLEAKNRM